MKRSTKEVIDDHLERARNGDIDEDIEKNFADDCVLLTTYGRFEGHSGLKQAAELLAEQIPKAQYDYVQTAFVDDLGFLEWTAHGVGATVRDGADSYLVRDGLIKAMTIHYTVQRY